LFIVGPAITSALVTSKAAVDFHLKVMSLVAVLAGAISAVGSVLGLSGRIMVVGFVVCN